MVAPRHFRNDTEVAIKFTLQEVVPPDQLVYNFSKKYNVACVLFVRQPNW